MMTYEQAKLAECLRSGHGATFGELERLLKWPFERILGVLVELDVKGWIHVSKPAQTLVWTISGEGEKAYQEWAKIPF
jgi:hypothetical protein